MVRADAGLEEEIGALRTVLHQVMDEERDLSRLVAGAARLTTAIVQAQRLQLQLAEGEEQGEE